jgi:hypothetical protein
MANITAVENDLIDEHVREEMSETDRRRFESRFLRRNREEKESNLPGLWSIC